MACNQQPRKPYRTREALNPPRPPPSWRRRAARRALALVREPYRFGVVLAVLMLLFGAALTRQQPAQLPELEQLAAVEVPDAGAEPDAGVVVDVHQDDGRDLRARHIPEKPPENWARAPCPAGYVEIRGTCWARLDNRPPCPVASYEHASRCYVPLLAAPKLPTSIDD